MLRIFKQNTPAQILILLLSAALLWAKAFIEPVPMEAGMHFSPLYDLLYEWLNTAPRLASAIALVLVIAEGIWLNIILVNYKIAKANSLMPTYLYFLAMSWSTPSLTITPMLIVNIMIICACSQMMSDGATTLSVSKNFNAAFCFGMAALCYMPALCFIIPFLFIFVTYKLYRWRDIIVGFLGIVAPSIVLFTYAFLKDKLQYDLILIAHDFSSLDLSFGSIPFLTNLPDMVFVIILVASLFNALSSLNEKTVNQRINTTVLTLPLLASISIMLLTGVLPIDAQLMAITFAFTANAFLYTERKRRWISESLFWIILIAAIL